MGVPDLGAFAEIAVDCGSGSGVPEAPSAACKAVHSESL